MFNHLLKLVTGSNKYANQKIRISTDLQTSNEKLAETLKFIGINKLILTSMGNSIATGYSISDIIKPLIFRNETLEETMNNQSIDIQTYNFSRAQDNNDDRVLQWLITNIKQSEINKQNHVDFGHSKISMERSGITDSDVAKFFPTSIKDDKGLEDIILEKQSDLANIVVYNGCTGSFLDNLTRKGKHINLYGFKKDLVSMESVLKTIYLKNKITQVYVCGIPNLLNINIVWLINKEIRKICDKYPNATYVQPAVGHMLYDKNNKLVIDIHHNQNEYLSLNNNIIKFITDNYISNMFYIELDQALANLSNTAQYDKHESLNDIDLVINYLYPIIKKYYDIFELMNKPMKPIIEKFIKYYYEKYPHDYFYIPKEKTIEIIKTTR